MMPLLTRYAFGRRGHCIPVTDFVQTLNKSLWVHKSFSLVYECRSFEVLIVICYKILHLEMIFYTVP